MPTRPLHTTVLLVTTRIHPRHGVFLVRIVTECLQALGIDCVVVQDAKNAEEAEKES